MVAVLDDELFARQLQAQFDEENEYASHQNQDRTCASIQRTAIPVSISDPTLELSDPTPNIFQLFADFNTTYFYGKLESVEVRWSPRMTLCAGVCCYQGRAGYCSIRLSEPLLKLRPRKDLVETLLHEMIHAYLFVTRNNRDREDHGPEFHKHMRRINAAAGLNISVYHSFHDEVDRYRVHWWRCDGPCQTRRPYFGLVKRAMNRAPGSNDPWFAEHRITCGGTFTKIKGPEMEKKAENGLIKKQGSTDALLGRKRALKGSADGNHQTSTKKRNFGQPNSSGSLFRFAGGSSATVTTKGINTGASCSDSSVDGKGFLYKAGSSTNGRILKDNLFQNTTSSASISTLNTTGISNESNIDKNTESRGRVGVGLSEVVPFSGKGYVLGGASSRSSTTTSTQPSLKDFIESKQKKNNTGTAPAQKGGLKRSQSAARMKLLVDLYSSDEEELTYASPSMQTPKMASTSGSGRRRDADFPASGVLVLSDDDDINENNVTTASDQTEIDTKPPDADCEDGSFVLCELCKRKILLSDFNSHLDECEVVNNIPISSAEDNLEDYSNISANDLPSIQVVNSSGQSEIAGASNDQSALGETNSSALPTDQGERATSDVIEAETNVLTTNDCVKCPVCDRDVLESLINQHLDNCLS